MAAALAPLTLERLLGWIRDERAARGTVFGLHQDLFRDDLAGRPFSLRRRGRRLESPVGVAAGPHTQLAPNLVAAWLCGARYLELKTIQERDRLDVPRPCIDMADEGYNCEWSQELPLDLSAGQYLDAWTAISVLRHEAADRRAPDDRDPGFVMDLSVGYDLAGIRGERMQRCLDRLTRSRAELERRLVAARAVYPHAGGIAVPDGLCDSVTLSTMHGCPPEEIERIGRFLLRERGLHTTIKLNPTLLGARAVRELLGERLGYAVEVPDEAFAGDLAWDAALDLIRSLRAEAARAGLGFGLKLTNTLAVRNTRGVLPASEPLVYLSGRALHPIAINLAAALQTAFAGELDISFAGGLDARNVARTIASGLGPATVCSDLLRPGGYQRLHQYLDALAAACGAVGAVDCESFVLRTAQAGGAVLAGDVGADADDLTAAALANLQAYAAVVADEAAYRKDTHPDRSVKTPRPLRPFDCIAAPCQVTCPAGQDVPGYLTHTARGEFREALAIVLRDNPLPTTTGMVCDHPCQPRCTRTHYEAPLRIRDVKRTLAHTAGEPPAPPPAVPTGRSVAIVGAGPAGLSCAWYLTLAGVQATVHEAKGLPGGMITDAIPAFRLADEDFARDLRRLVAAGVVIRTGEAIDRARLEALRREHDAVFVAIGAQADRELELPGEDLPGVWPALRFLSAARGAAPLPLGAAVAVIGGGNTAMDAARTALRLVAPGGEVQVVYRRTRDQMPAAQEELAAIQAEGAVIRELLAPQEISRTADGRLALVCQRMRLGAPDGSGRPRPEPVPGASVTLVVDAIIPAVGQRLQGDVLTGDDLSGAAADVQTRLDRVFAGGDALRGPATLVEAIGDGRRAAEAILAQLGLPVGARTPDGLPSGTVAPWRELSDPAWQDRAARLAPPILPPVRATSGRGDFGLLIGELSPAEARAEAARCLDCAVRCDVCVSVCPDRANVAYDVRPVRWPLVRVVVGAGTCAGASFAAGEAAIDLVPDGDFVLDQARQIASIIDFCNECGNCETFCPTAGAPFRDKPRLALLPETFARHDGACRLVSDDRTHTIERRRGDACERLTRSDGVLVYETEQARLELDATTFAVREVTALAPGPWELDLRPAAELAVLLDGLADHPLAAAATEAR